MNYNTILLNKISLRFARRGCLRAATGKDKNSDFNKEIPSSTGRNKSSECIGWLPILDTFRTLDSHNSYLINTNILSQIENILSF